MRRIYIWTALLVFLTSAAASAQIPGIVSYQGFITSRDSALSGSYDVNLNVYDSPNGGNSVWSQKTAGVQVVKGYYTVLMNFDANWQNNYVDFHKQYWLEAQVGGQTLLPRVQLTSSPFSINARRADTAAVALKLVQDAPIGTVVAYAGQALGLAQEKQTG